jgi:hypothetical protein
MTVVLWYLGNNNLQHIPQHHARTYISSPSSPVASPPAPPVTGGAVRGARSPSGITLQFGDCCARNQLKSSTFAHIPESTTSEAAASCQARLHTRGSCQQVYSMHKQVWLWLAVIYQKSRARVVFLAGPCMGWCLHCVKRVGNIHYLFRFQTPHRIHKNEFFRKQRCLFLTCCSSAGYAKL